MIEDLIALFSAMTKGPARLVIDADPYPVSAALVLQGSGGNGPRVFEALNRESIAECIADLGRQYKESANAVTREL